jgi:membrane associated rhomboid family serine protease
MPAYGYLVMWLGLQLLYGSLAHSMDFSDVGWFAHIGGFVFGAAVAYVRKKSSPGADQSA